MAGEIGSLAAGCGGREAEGMFGMSLLEAIVLGTACMGVPLLGAGIVVAIAMPLRSTTTADDSSSGKLPA